MVQARQIIPFIFYCLFSRPLVDFGIWSADIPEGTSRKNESNDDENYYQYVRNAVIHPQAKVMQGKHFGILYSISNQER